MEKIVILGLGNVLYGDEGFGVRVVERLHASYEIEELRMNASPIDSVLAMASERDEASSSEKSEQMVHIEIIDGGIESDFIPDAINDIDKLLIVYTANYGQETGTVTSEKASEFSLLQKKVQSGLTDFIEDNESISPSHAVLKAIMENMAFQNTHANHRKTEVHTISLQPKSMQYGEGLSPNALASLDNASAMAAHVLEKWGVHIATKENSLLDIPSLALFNK